jgi:RNase P/RNase MRP subunit POP5
MIKKQRTHILPSARGKERYMVFEITSKEKIDDFSRIKDAIYDRSLHFLGELGISKANLYILKDKWNQDLQRGMIRVDHKHTHELRAALSTLNDINGNKVNIKTVGMSGILKKAEEKYLKK